MTAGANIPTINDLREQIASLFTTSPVSDHQQSVGLELETLPLRTENEEPPQSVDITNESGSGVLDIIQKAAAGLPDLSFAPRTDGTPQFKSAEGGNITFEPGGQIEYSSSECYQLQTAIEEMAKYIKRIREALEQNQLSLFHGGINPWQSVADVDLKMRKTRYRQMDQYFQELGPYGQQMMRLTLSIQVNLDFGGQRTARPRWFAANLLAPVMCAVFGNSPFAQGAPTGQKSYRSFIWQNMDNCRTGFPNPEKLNCPDMDQVDQYLIYALDANVIKLHHEATINGKPKRFISFRQWLNGEYPGREPEMADWEEHISLLFPEVRPRGFLEFRTLDGPSRNWWTVPVTLLTAILYDDNARSKVLELLEPYCLMLEQLMQEAANQGVKAFPDIAQKVFQIGLDTDSIDIPADLREHCERFYKTFTAREKNPADELLKLNHGRIFTLQQLHDHEQKLQEWLSPPACTLLT